MVESPQCKARAPRALLIVHSSASDPGYVGRALEKRGFDLDIRSREQGEALPHGMEEHDVAVIFGGPMSANDEAPFILSELKWTEQALQDKKPLLGICLGAQMMARTLGASVDLHERQRVEAGFYPIFPTHEGRDIFPERLHVYQWHQEGFSMPKDTTLLAGGADFPHQAFSYGDHAYGLQFHPEVTLPIIQRWLRRGGKRLRMGGARAHKTRHFLDYVRYDRTLQRWFDRFLDQFFLREFYTNKEERNRS